VPETAGREALERPADGDRTRSVATPVVVRRGPRAGHQRPGSGRPGRGFGGGRRVGVANAFAWRVSASRGRVANDARSTRLETRTKECSSRASRWGASPKAQRSRGAGAPPADRRFAGEWFEPGRAGCDPKDGELCLSRAKPEETLVEARRRADVQIAFRTWA